MSDLKTIQNRLEKNYKHLKKWAARSGIEAFRIYEKDIPEFPFIVDVYKDHAVIFEKRDEEIDAEKFNHFEFIITAVKNVLNIPEEKVVIKSRFRQKGATQYTKLEEKNEFFSVKEHEARYLVNLHDYLDTGLFLDHRPLRQIIYKSVSGKKVLNLFSYTGSISVMAALGGAKVTSVDMSATYMDWAKKNFEENQIPLKEHNFIVDSALEYLEKASSRFDVIVLDPPTFSNSKKMEEDFEVEKDQVFLIKHCLRLLNPEGGVLYFSNNKRSFKIDPAISEMALVQDITARTIPEDYRNPKIHHCFKITHKVKA